MRTRLLPVFPLLVSILLPGCTQAQDGGPAQEDPAGPLPSSGPGFETGPEPSGAVLQAEADTGPRIARVFGSCTYNCFEPSLAVDSAGRMLATTALGDRLARSLDGRAWEEVPPVPLPAQAPPGATPADAWVTSHGQRIFYVAPLLGTTGGLLSIHVASTPDAGLAWDRNVLVALTGPGHDVVAGADRPWLGFVGDTVLLTYNNLATGIWVARSLDGGLGFGPMQPLSAQVGSPLPTAAGPAVAAGASAAVPLRVPPGVAAGQQVVATSTDGLLWTAQAVAPQSTWFPILASDGGGALALGFNDADGHARLACSPGWDAVAWSDGEVEASPWPVAAGEGWAMAWFERTGHARYRLVAAYAAGCTEPEQRWVLAQDVAAPPEGYGRKGDIPNTDFASLAWTPGALVAVWSDDATHSTYAAHVPLPA